MKTGLCAIAFMLAASAYAADLVTLQPGVVIALTSAR